MSGASDGKDQILLIGGAGDLSGVPRHVCQLANALHTKAKVTVLSDVNKGGFDPLLKLGIAHLIVPGLGSRRSPTQILKTWWSLTKALRTTHTNLVWLHAPLPVLLARLSLALRVWRPNCPVICTFHALPFTKRHPFLARLFSTFTERIILTFAPRHHLVFLTPEIAKRTKQALGSRLVERHFNHVLPNCSDLGLLPVKKRDAACHLVMTGRRSWQKNHEHALRLFLHLPNDTTLTLCGPGTDSTEFQGQASRMLPQQAFERINFIGPVHDVRPFLANADGYLLTSRYEGLPIGALEAFEVGIPLVLSDFDGAAALADLHPCGICLTSGDFASRAIKIKQLLERFKKHESEHREATRHIWRRYWSPERFSVNTEAFILEILKTNPENQPVNVTAKFSS